MIETNERLLEFKQEVHIFGIIRTKVQLMDHVRIEGGDHLNI